MKAKYYLNIWGLLLFFCGNYSCERDNVHEDLFLKNGSNKAIYYIFDFEGYPDTSIRDGGPVALNNPDSYKIEPNSSKRVRIGAQANWEGLYKRSTSDTIMFFIFDAQTMENTPWDTISKKYLILKRYDFSFQDLEQKNWTITYP